MPRPLEINRKMRSPERFKWRINRFMSHVRKLQNGCWQYTAFYLTDSFGIEEYPRVCSPHRLSYLLFRGTIPFKVRIKQSCGTKHCVNPKHLRLRFGPSYHKYKVLQKLGYLNQYGIAVNEDGLPSFRISSQTYRQMLQHTK